MPLVCSNYRQQWYTVSLERFTFQSWTFRTQSTLSHSCKLFFPLWEWKKKRWGWGRKQLGLVLVKPDLLGDLLFFWLQIICSNQAVFENCEGMSMGFLARLILEHRHIPRGQSAQVHCLLEMSLGGRAWQVTFFFQWAVIRALLAGWPAPVTAKWKQEALRRGTALLPARVSAQVNDFSWPFSCSPSPGWM